MQNQHPAGTRLGAAQRQSPPCTSGFLPPGLKPPVLLQEGTNTSGRGTQKAASLSCGRTDRQTACGRAGCQAWVLEPVSQSPSQSRGPLQNAECFAKQTEAAVLGACCWWLFTSFQRGFSHLSHPAPASPLTPCPTQLSWHRSSPGWAPQTTRDAGTAGPQCAPTPCPRASHKPSNPRWQHL